MKTAVWIRALAVIALMASGCSSTTSAGNGPSPSASASAASSPVAISLPQAYLALVTLRGSNSYVVRDLTDINHPKTVSNVGDVPGLQFISATEIAVSSGGLFRIPLSTNNKVLVSSQATGGFAWSPDGSAVVYIVQANPDTATVHLLKDGHDQVLGSIPGGGGGGCESIAGCAIANSLDFRILYSPDGTTISVVTLGFSGSVFRLWSSDGKLLKSSDAAGPTMSAWSGSSLYFRDASGVEVWRNGAIQPFLSRVIWIGPKGSPGGGQIVYAARDGSGWAHTYVVDTTTGKVRELKKARAHPVFLTSRFIWYQGERACVAADACGATPPWHPLSGKNYIYDLQTGTETESIITGVSDVWPHPA
jgi:hypothetical protein